jgi:hypothetical protein
MNRLASLRFHRQILHHQRRSYSTAPPPTSPVQLGLLFTTTATLLTTAYTLYAHNALLERNYEEAEARMDELEGTLRGHIGIIEESLERIEKSAGTRGLGGGMGDKAEALYGARGRDEKKGK